LESEREFDRRMIKLATKRVNAYNKRKGENMINKLVAKVEKDMAMTKRDMITDGLENDEFYRGVLSAYQIVLDMVSETKAENPYLYTNDLENTIIDGGEDLYMAKKGVPKHDGSGKGSSKNAGRGGCKMPRNRPRSRFR